VQVNAEVLDESCRREDHLEVGERPTSARADPNPYSSYFSKLALMQNEMFDTIGEPVGVHFRLDVLTVDVLAGNLVQLHPTQRVNFVRFREKLLVEVRAVCLATDFL